MRGGLSVDLFKSPVNASSLLNLIPPSRLAAFQGLVFLLELVTVALAEAEALPSAPVTVAEPLALSDPESVAVAVEPEPDALTVAVPVTMADPAPVAVAVSAPVAVAVTVTVTVAAPPEHGQVPLPATDPTPSVVVAALCWHESLHPQEEPT